MLEKIPKSNEYWRLHSFKDTFFEMIFNLAIKRKALSLFPLGYTIYHLWDPKVIYIFGLKMNLFHSETFSLIAIVLIFAEANLLTYSYWNVIFKMLCLYSSLWAKGIIYLQKTYSN